MQSIISGVVGVLLFILFLPYSLTVLLGLVFLILCFAPQGSNKTNRKVERWSRKRKRYY